jgi:transcriptional regulator NrdR family protein
MQLRDPEACPICGADSRVVQSQHTPTHRWRRRQCIVCKGSWRTFESLINPRKITLKPIRRTT